MEVKAEVFPLTHQSAGSASLQRRNQGQISSQNQGSACYQLLLSDRTVGKTERQERQKGRESQHHADQSVHL